MFGQVLEPNDRILFRNVSERGGTGKLRSYWKNDIYVVVSCDPELPIYKIKQENDNKPVKTVLRNLLLKCNELPFDKKNLNLKKSKWKISLLRKTSSHYNSELENEIKSLTEFVLINQNNQNHNPPVLTREEERRDETKNSDTSNINEKTNSSEHQITLHRDQKWIGNQILRLLMTG